MGQSNHRLQRVGDAIQRALAQLISEEVHDPRLGMVTISEVVLSRDLAFAKVYVTVLGDSKETEESIKVLNSAAGFLRKLLGSHLTTRNTPQLKFIFDSSVETGSHLSALIDRVVAEDKDSNES